jgi:hypothetical protein
MNDNKQAKLYNEVCLTIRWLLLNMFETTATARLTELAQMRRINLSVDSHVT